MTDKYPGLVRGKFPDAVTRNAIADEAIAIYSPVIRVTAGTGELEDRVEPNNTQGAVCAGIVVDGSNRGYAGGSDENAASAAGEAVEVCTHGRCKVRVNGSTGAIAVNDPLTIDAADGFAEKAAAGDFVIGYAKQASTGASDYIICDVTLEGVL